VRCVVWDHVGLYISAEVCVEDAPLPEEINTKVSVDRVNL